MAIALLCTGFTLHMSLKHLLKGALCFTVFGASGSV